MVCRVLRDASLRSLDGAPAPRPPLRIGNRVFISSITDRGATPALVKTLAFNQAKLRMIAENVANSETPGYRAKQLDTKAFQAALRTALEARRGDPKKPFVVRSGNEVTTDARGFLKVTPSTRPVENILFHDGTNMSIERQMAALAETGMTHELVTMLLDGRFGALRKAISGGIS